MLSSLRRMKPRLILLVAGCLFSTLAAHWEPDLRLTDDPASSKTAENNNTWTVGACGDTVHVVWTDNRDGNDEIYCNSSTDGGTSWGGDRRLTNADRRSWCPSVATAGADVHVVWEDNRDIDWHDAYYKRSTDGGVSWSTPLKLTTPGTVSCRYPSICDRLWQGDSLAVFYLEDQCAGSVIMGQGPATHNPVVVQKVPIDSIVARSPYAGRLVRPNGDEVVVGGDTFAVTWTVTPKTFDHGVLSLSTDGGSTFPTVLKASIPPEDTFAIWDSIPAVTCSLCRVKFEARDSLGATVFSDVSNGNFTIDSAGSGVSEDRLELGKEVRLLKPEPNPFVRTTVARLLLRMDMPVKADIYNAVGQKVRSLASGIRRAGAHTLVWDGTDERGRRVQAGAYYLRVATEGGTVTQAVVLSL